MKAPTRRQSRYTWWNLMDFQKAFPDEKSCYDFLYQTLWAKGFLCPSCKGKKCWFVPSRFVYQCSICRRHISLTAGTIFHKSKIPLHKWFWMIFLMANSKKGISAANAQRLLGMRSYKDVWLMMHKIRVAMQTRDEQYQLRGIVETDESYYGGRRRGGKVDGKTGRGSGQTPVLITSENKQGKPGYAHMRVLQSIGAESISQAVSKSIRKGSTIKSDGFQSYRKIDQQGFQHDRQVIGKDRSRSTKVLPWVHILASNSKRFLLSTHQGRVSPKYLDHYLAEFGYRYNRRRWHGQLFERLLYACLSCEPASLDAISG